jgi:signal transduction histidine kinase
MNLYWRIVLPFVLGLVLIISSGTFMANYLLGRDADKRLATHLSAVAQRISRAGFALNRPFLEQLKAAVDAEAVLVGSQGEIIAATFDDAESAATAARHALALVRRQTLDPQLETVDVVHREYKALAIPVAALSDSPQVLALFAPLAPIQASRAQVALTLAFLSFIGLVLMFFWGHFITRSIIRPINRLAISTQMVANGDFQHQSERPAIPELLALSDSFNQMVVKIREAEERLVRSERLAITGRIAATVAHEVRNPLSAIRMLAQIAGRSQPAGTSAFEACQKILREIDRLEMLVKGLLESTNARPLQLTPVRLGDILREISELTGLQLEHRGVRMTIESEADVPEIRIDRDRVKQVILNLLLNGAEAMPGGGPLKIDLRRANAADGTKGIELTVLDRGNGISQEAQQRIFEPFFTTKPEGAGLGLSVSRRIVEQHRGTLTLSNLLEGGAVARVWLPIVDE